MDVTSRGKNIFFSYSAVPLQTDSTTLRIVWAPDRVIFEVLRGHTDEPYRERNGYFRCQTEEGNGDVPSTDMQVWMGLYIEKNCPQTNDEAEIVVHEFRYTKRENLLNRFLPQVVFQNPTLQD